MLCLLQNFPKGCSSLRKSCHHDSAGISSGGPCLPAPAVFVAVPGDDLTEPVHTKPDLEDGLWTYLLGGLSTLPLSVRAPDSDHICPLDTTDFNRMGPLTC